MAVVDEHLARSLQRAAAKGRIRDEAIRLFTHAKANPRQAGRILAKGLRALRGLHSRDRRALGDRLYWWIRHDALLVHALQTNDPFSCWLGLLVHKGLPASEAIGLWEAEGLGNPPPFARTLPLPEPTSLAMLGSIHPNIADRLSRDFGEEADAFLRASNQRAPMTLRANRHKGCRDTLAQRLQREGVETRPGRWSADALEVIGRCHAPSLESYREGLFEVQDEGSQLLSELVTTRGPILDLCAGAGGKSLAMASRGLGPITATDVRRRALQELSQRAKRSQLNIHTQPIEADRLPQNLQAMRFGCVLVDAPCSGFGVLRRHPEHRWLLDDARLLELNAIQDALLERAVSVTQPGGEIVYGTCSVLKEENGERIERFLTRHPDWRVVSAPTQAETRDGPFLSLSPHQHGTDGFFGAILRAPE